MTYSINVRPYNDPYIKIVEEGVGAAGELAVDLWYFPRGYYSHLEERFPGAKAAVIRKYAA